MWFPPPAREHFYGSCVFSSWDSRSRTYIGCLFPFPSRRPVSADCLTDPFHLREPVHHPPSSPQTPFTFGLGQRAPYTAGERCLLCRSERKDCPPLDAGSTGSSGTCGSPKAGGLLQLPLWVCPECRRTVETEERPGVPEQPLPVRRGRVLAHHGFDKTPVCSGPHAGQA